LLKPFTVEDLTAAMIAGRNPAKSPGNAVHLKSIPLDEAIYKKLAASMRKERLQQLYALCLGDVTERIARMRQTASNKDDAAFRKEAHALRGGAGMVGAIELQTMAASLEENGLHANHVASLDGLTVACGRLRRILSARKVV
jgi:HPt (histidine-containing phosphotransfer) domain-containing protein